MTVGEEWSQEIGEEVVIQTNTSVLPTILSRKAVIETFWGGVAMVRIWLACLLLVGAAWADVPYRDKLLTAADVKRFLPAGWCVVSSLEDFEFREYLGMKQYDYGYKQGSVLYLKSAWGVRLDSAAAKSEYSKLVAVQALNPLVKVDANLSSQVRVGDESLCVRLRGGRIYALCFREGRNVGFFTLGIRRPMSGKELEKLAQSWVRRAKSR